jgi:hypothetical protein
MRNIPQVGKNQEHQMGLELKYQLTGWILFIICAIFFIAASLKNHDALTFIGGVIFLIACIVFLIPLVRPNKKAGGDTTLHDD